MSEDFHDASSIWQIELKDTDRRGGRPIQWSDSVRFKNILAGNYLGLTRKGDLTPVEKTGPTLFTLLETTRCVSVSMCVCVCLCVCLCVSVCVCV